MTAFRFVLAILLVFLWSASVRSDAIPNQEVQVLETMEVIGVTPVHGVGLSKGKLPYSVQSASDKDLRRAQSLDLTQYMNRNLGSVTINDAQNNPLQPDIQYRGFSASPLLGLPQGISVYQNGVRIQEPLGDTINWELLPENAVASINLIGGASPLFGLNTLGGALSIQTKNGFTYPGQTIEAYGGSFGRVVAQAESGWSNEKFGYFTAINYFDEEGWRDASNSDVKNFFGAVGWRGETSTLDLSFTYGDSRLIGNGPLPVQLLKQDREAFFTLPDRTENEVSMGILEFSHWIDNDNQLSGNMYYRIIDTDSFNGDGSEFEECMLAANSGSRCENPGAGEVIVLDQFGNPVLDEDDAINNISTQEQRSYGGTFQNTFLYDMFGLENQLIAGGGWNQGFAEFDSEVEVAQLNNDRSTTQTGRFVQEEATRVKTRTRTWSLYMTDTLSLTPDLNVTVSGRFNSTRIVIRDRSGINPALNGDHDFDRFNPAGGISWQAHQLLNIYGSYSESTRAPTPVELVCADPGAPCNLPNAFLADPPLDQVVAKTLEAGLRGELTQIGDFDVGRLNWNVVGFHTINEDDIIFQSTGGVAANEGFFDNIGDTRRTGVELGLNGSYGAVDWFLNYSFVEATFRDSFSVSSPNHPRVAANGTIPVNSGDSIPGIANHNLKFGTDITVIPNLTIGWDALYNSGRYLRGDEGNLLNQTGDFIVFNLRGEYRFNKYLSVFWKVDNVFDKEYETFGLLGEPNEVLGDAFNDPRFLGPGAKRGFWGGIRISL